MNYCWDLQTEWNMSQKDNQTLFQYPFEGDFYEEGFVKRHAGAADLMDFEGLFLTLSSQKEQRVKVTIYFADKQPVSCERSIVSGTKQCILVSWKDFPVEIAKENYWQYVTKIQIDTGAVIQKCQLRKRTSVYADFPVRGKSGHSGETVVYCGTVYNCSDEPLWVKAAQIYEGWESVKLSIHWKNLPDTEEICLNPGEKKDIEVSFQIHDNMVEGGHETSTILFRTQGSISGEESITLQTMRALPHPYLYHNTDGWKKVEEKIGQYSMYQPEWERYQKLSEEWTVTKPFTDRPYCYLTEVENAVIATAYCYAITHRLSYAEKLAQFFRFFADKTNGYPEKKRGCSQSYVQEGHFFQHLAIAYDIIYDAGVLSEQDHLALSDCFRLYMDMLDAHIRSGAISNWLLSEIQGAVYCAMVLQDIERMERFVYGNGGSIMQFSKGIFNDGWWHECSIGYNTWVSSMMIHMARALQCFGYDIVHQKFALPFNKEVGSTYALTPPEVKSGMFNQKWGGNQKISVGIQDMFDAALPYLDYRGVMFGIADSDEKKLDGVHWGSTYDLAYSYYGNPEYIPVIQRSGLKDPVFGHPVLPDVETDTHTKNAYSDNIGIAMLRSQKKGRPQREQIQAVLRYGSHGNAHGHFDICDLLSVMRYGRSFYNPENCWWGYAHFMYKFYVQCSLTKNMVVVDEKMQIPADSRRILFYTGKSFQAAGVEVTAKWAYPPYGGMVYYQDNQTNTKEELKKRCKMNACYLPIVDDPAVVYGEMSGYTEPVRQRRILVVTDDYIVLFDTLQGEQEHTFDSLMQIKGFQGIEGEHIDTSYHTEQWNSNPVSDAQFVTDCQWYRSLGVSTAHFKTVFTPEMYEESKDCDRSNYNEPGILKLDVHTAWPKQTEQMIGRVAVYSGWAADNSGYTIPLKYRVEADGMILADEAFDAWILGRGECDFDVTGKETLRLIVKNGVRYDEAQRSVQTPQALFWGEANLICRDGSVRKLRDLPYQTVNIDSGFGIGRDYQNGRVTIVGTEYPDAVPTSPVNHAEEGIIEINLKGLDAVRFQGCIGCDAFPGDESQKRKTYAVRTRGTCAEYITVIEPFEDKAMIEQVCAEKSNEVTVRLRGGKTQYIRLLQGESDSPVIQVDTCETGNTIPNTIQTEYSF
ncbi:MAG: hypothetical protein Q4E24_07560 [bacterium]|nr:hypothetical protein [bacterium]